MKRAVWILLSVCLLLGLMAGCGAGDDTATAEEAAAVRQMLTDRAYGTDHFQVYVLYDSLERPAYLMGVSDACCLICRRRDFRFCESSASCPYRDYLDVKKYYAPPICYVIRAEDVIGGPENPAGKFYYLHADAYGSFGRRFFRPAVYIPSFVLLAVGIVSSAVIRRRKKH